MGRHGRLRGYWSPSNGSRRIIYLASPYSSPDPELKVWRFEQAAKAAAKILSDGELVFAPIPMTHPMAIYGDLSGAWEQWEKFDSYMLSLCHEMRILMLEGWQDSKGVAAEKALAYKLGIPVTYMEP